MIKRLVSVITISATVALSAVLIPGVSAAKGNPCVSAAILFCNTTVGGDQFSPEWQACFSNYVAENCQDGVVARKAPSSAQVMAMLNRKQVNP